MSDKNNTRIAALLLIILTVLVFQRVLNSEFITTDDRTYIANNPYVTPGLTLRGIAWAFKQVRLCLKYGYHPDPGFVQALSTKMPER